jgi:hypothetical protein
MKIIKKKTKIKMKIIKKPTGSNKNWIFMYDTDNILDIIP